MLLIRLEGVVEEAPYVNELVTGVGWGCQGQKRRNKEGVGAGFRILWGALRHKGNSG